MTRGLYNTLNDNDSYKKANKSWYVELLRSEFYWYDLIINQNNMFDIKTIIKKNLKDLSKQIQNQLDKRFIYFIGARKRIRFSTKKEPRYSLLSERLNIWVEVGRERKLRKIAVKIKDLFPGQVARLEVETRDRFITFTNKSNEKFIFSVHDFLNFIDHDDKIGTKIFYVGFTKNPWKRPIDGVHRGLGETSYRVSSDEYDLFIYYNLFKVTTNAFDPSRNIKWHIANSMTDEVNVELEGKILEKALILYFEPETQVSTLDNERTELENTIVSLSREINLTSIHFHYEMDEPCDYYRFFSNKIKPKDRHVFTYEMNGDSLILSEGSKLYDDAYVDKEK